MALATFTAALALATFTAASFPPASVVASWKAARRHLTNLIARGLLCRAAPEFSAAVALEVWGLSAAAAKRTAFDDSRVHLMHLTA
jgi:hypothetical protein